MAEVALGRPLSCILHPQRRKFSDLKFCSFLIQIGHKKDCSLATSMCLIEFWWKFWWIFVWNVYGTCADVNIWNLISWASRMSRQVTVPHCTCDWFNTTSKKNTAYHSIQHSTSRIWRVYALYNILQPAFLPPNPNTPIQHVQHRSAKDHLFKSEIHNLQVAHTTSCASVFSMHRVCFGKLKGVEPLFEAEQESLGENLLH